jgi:hypothetical protein
LIWISGQTMIAGQADMMIHEEFVSGEPAPSFGLYQELNVFGTPTGKVLVMVQEETFPTAPRGFKWRALTELSVSELRAKATQYRAMAGTATTEAVMTALLRLAERFDALADQRDVDRAGRGQ